jgi:TRAP-type C4-dicarboxylate transport system substrate-binding protein
MAFTELYLALQTGTVDAQENPINNIYANRMHEVQKFLSLTGHAYTASIIVMNLSKFNALPPDQQKALVDAAREAAIHQRDLNARQESENLAKIRAAGIEVTEAPDVASFRKLVYEPVTKTYTDQHGKETVDAILSTR